MAALAQNLQQLVALTHAVEGLEVGSHRVRAALAVLHAHCELGRLIGAQRGRSWCERGLRSVERSIAALRPRDVPAAFDTGAALLSELRRAPSTELVWDATLCARIEWLVSGLGLRGRAALLYGIVLELATRPVAAAGVAAQAPAPFRPEAERLAASGTLRLGRHEVFVGRIDENSADLFSPSLALLRACARRGALAVLEQVSRRVRASCRERARLEVVALYVAGEPSAALGRLARLPRADRDRTAFDLVQSEIDGGDTRRAETLARSIRAPVRRAQALAAVLHSEALRLVVRRELCRSLPRVSPLERALLAGEIAVVHGSTWGIECALEELAKLLGQHTPSTAFEVALPEPRRASAWERALRCALALAVCGELPPERLRFPRPILPALLKGRFVRGELRSVLPLAQSALDSLIERLPGRYERIGAVLRAMHVERRAELCRDFIGTLELDAELDRRLAQPESRTEALLAGVLLERDQARIGASALDPLRAAYDLGVAISPGVERRRRVLFRAARAAFRAAGGPEYGELLNLRIALLRQLQDTSAEVLAEEMLKGKTLPKSARMALLELVARKRPQLASALVWKRFAEVTDRGRDAPEMLDLLERCHGLEKGTSREWLKLRSACQPCDAAEFVTQFSNTWQAQLNRALDRRLLAACADALGRDELPRDGRRAAELILAGVRRWQDIGLLSFFTRASVRDLEWLILTCEPDPARAWSVLRWQRFVDRLNTELGAVDDSITSRFTQRLGSVSAQVLVALRSGAPPTDGLRAPVPLGSGLELVYLDKRRDLLPFLRFADCAPCCFSSDGSHHEQGMKTSRWILRVYKDPLSFCFHVRRSENRERVGFVFGGFALAREPVLLLNGVYLKRQQRGLRFRILEAIEHTLARSLGVTGIGVANIHGGHGELPNEYTLRTRRGTRLRALRGRDGLLETSIYDDLSGVVNKEADLTLHWKALDYAAAQA